MNCFLGKKVPKEKGLRSSASAYMLVYRLRDSYALQESLPPPISENVHEPDIFESCTSLNSSPLVSKEEATPTQPTALPVSETELSQEQVEGIATRSKKENVKSGTENGDIEANQKSFMKPAEIKVENNDLAMDTVAIMPQKIAPDYLHKLVEEVNECYRQSCQFEVSFLGFV